MDPTVVEQLIKLSENIHAGLYSFKEKRGELNELVFDLYDLNRIDKQRIVDFYVPKNKSVTKQMFEDYCLTFYKTIKRFLKTGIMRMEYSYNPNIQFDITGVKIIFGVNDNVTSKPQISNVQLYINHELLKQVGNSALIALKQRIYSDDSIFIIKDTNPRSWTKSAAYDDAKIEIEKLLRR